MNTGSVKPLTNGIRRQTEAAQACIRNGVNAAGQKACDNLKDILQNAGEALKTGNPQPAFIIGAKKGVETYHMRVEMSANTIHGHPIIPEEFKKYIK